MRQQNLKLAEMMNTHQFTFTGLLGPTNMVVMKAQGILISVDNIAIYDRNSYPPISYEYIYVWTIMVILFNWYVSGHHNI